MGAVRNQWVNPSQRSWQSISVNSLYGTLAEANIDASVGSVGDSYDSALAETINGLYKTEVIGNIPRAGFEIAYYRQLKESANAA